AQHSAEPLQAKGKERGPALGIFEKAVYPNQTHTLSADDLILLFTDGLFEVENSKEELFSEARLLETVSHHTDLGPEPLLNAVVKDVEDFTDGNHFSDDVCVVGVHVTRLP
ncbi:MAG: PP2C family protein-serine/threonine phosphatase, partial [Verrucomicrobiota bacterium]